MKTSQFGISFICSYEKFASKPYRDAKGVWSIGFGHAMFGGITIPGPITLEEATTIMAGDLAKAEHSVLALVTVPLSQNEFDALVSFVFNCGSGNLAGSTLLKRINAGDTAGAGEQFQRWDHCDGEELDGLLDRRLAERDIFIDNNYVNHD